MSFVLRMRRALPSCAAPHTSPHPSENESATFGGSGGINDKMAALSTENTLTMEAGSTEKEPPDLKENTCTDMKPGNKMGIQEAQDIKALGAERGSNATEVGLCRNTSRKCSAGRSVPTKCMKYG